MGGDNIELARRLIKSGGDFHASYTVMKKNGLGSFKWEISGREGKGGGGRERVRERGREKDKKIGSQPGRQKRRGSLQADIET